MNSRTRKNSIPKRAQNIKFGFLKRFDWTNTLLTESEKQAIEHILVEYHDIFVRQRMDIGMNTEFKVKITPKDNKAVYSQSLPLERRPNCQIGSNAQIWNHYSTALLQVREPNIALLCCQMLCFTSFIISRSKDRIIHYLDVLNFMLATFEIIVALVIQIYSFILFDHNIQANVVVTFSLPSKNLLSIISG